MVSKITPYPVRMAPAIRAKVQAIAKEAGTSEHAAIVALIKAGLEVGVSPRAIPPREVLAKAEAAAAHLAKPPKRRWRC